MLKPKHLKSRLLLRFLLLFGIVGFLSYCTSSDRMASSFGKRKYTKGLFADRVAKLKTEYKPWVAVAQKTKAVINTTTGNQTKEVNTATDNTVIQPNTDKKQGISVTGNSSIPITSNVSKEGGINSVKEESGNDYIGHAKPAPTVSGIYFTGFIISLILTVIFTAIIAGLYFNPNSGVTDSAGVGCVLILLDFIAFISTMIFLILWIVNLAR